jgi:hypothetical protein
MTGCGTGTVLGGGEEYPCPGNQDGCGEKGCGFGRKMSSGYSRSVFSRPGPEGAAVESKTAVAERATDGSCATSTKECGSDCGKGCGCKWRCDVGGDSSEESLIEFLSPCSSTAGSSGGYSWWSEGMLGDLLH